MQLREANDSVLEANGNLSINASETHQTNRVAPRSTAESSGGAIDLGKYDIICGRHKDAEDHVGNRRFRVIVDIHKGKYAEATSKDDKTRVSLSVVAIVRNCGGGFLKVDPSTGRWYDIGDSAAREKVSLALRLANNTKAEKIVKKRKREECKTPLPHSADDAMVAKLLIIQQQLFRKLIEEADHLEEEEVLQPLRKRQRPSSTVQAH